ncbi:MAG: hypothetical protein WCS53_01660 [Bacilli bacterium]|jgi:hypothetical protein
MKCYLCGQPATTIYEPTNPFSPKTTCPLCGTYYLEPAFRAQMEHFQSRFGNEAYQKALQHMQQLTQAGLMVFVGNYEAPLTQSDGKYREIQDIIHAIGYQVPTLNKMDR